MYIVSGSRSEAMKGRQTFKAPCDLCGDLQYPNNLRRHKNRCHPSGNNVPRTDTSASSSACSSRSSSPASHAARSSTTQSPHTSQILLNHMIKEAVHLMMRRTDDILVSSLKEFLSVRFPDIPENLREVIIVAAFTAANKAAATHIDAMLPETDERCLWARRLLARWSHGMSVEDSPEQYTVPETNFTSTNPLTHLPTINHLPDDQLPIPEGIQSQQLEAQRMFDRNTELIIASAGQNAPAADSTPLAPPVTDALQTLVSVAQGLVLPHQEPAAGTPMSAQSSEQSISVILPVAEEQVAPANVHPPDSSLPMASMVTSNETSLELYSDLLLINPDDQFLMDDLTQPLLDMVNSPKTDQTNSLSTQKSPGSETRSTPEAEHTATSRPISQNKPDRKESRETGNTNKEASPKKPKIDRPPKENLGPERKHDNHRLSNHRQDSVFKIPFRPSSGNNRRNYDRSPPPSSSRRDDRRDSKRGNYGRPPFQGSTGRSRLGREPSHRDTRPPPPPFTAEQLRWLAESNDWSPRR